MQRLGVRKLGWLLAVGLAGFLSLAQAPAQQSTEPVAPQPQEPAAQRQSQPRHAPDNAPTSAPKPSDRIPEYVLSALLSLIVLELGGITFLFFKNKRLQQDFEGEQNKYNQLKQKLEYQALYDALTQLPNRRLFWDRMLHTIKVYNRNKVRFGVMMADLDKFKIINDTMGHDAGDILLQEVSQRMRNCIRESDTVARMGGDEFAFICPSVQDMATASIICLRLINAMREPIIIKGKPVQVGISLGIAIYPDHAMDEEMLVRRADIALYRAKQKRNTFVMFDPNIDRTKQVENL